MVSVVGSGSALTPEQDRVAEELGAALVEAGFGILCGGLGGVMEAVARGGSRARPVGARWPPIIGIVPGYDASAGNAHLDVVLPTGMGHARNALVAAGGEAVVCVAGAAGALSEVALAAKMGRPVLALPRTGGAAGLVGTALPGAILAESPAGILRELRRLLP